MTRAEIVSRSEWRKRVLRAYKYLAVPGEWSQRAHVERDKELLTDCLGRMLSPATRADCFDLMRLSVSELRTAIATADTMLSDPLLGNRDYERAYVV